MKFLLGVLLVDNIADAHSFMCMRRLISAAHGYFEWTLDLRTRILNVETLWGKRSSSRRYNVIACTFHKIITWVQYQE